jgi:hypothetical protein
MGLLSGALLNPLTTEHHCEYQLADAIRAKFAPITFRHGSLCVYTRISHYSIGRDAAESGETARGRCFINLVNF